MILEVNSEWRIVSDASQWIVQRWYEPQKEGSKTEPAWIPVAYFTRPDIAALWLSQRRIREHPGTYPAGDALVMLGEALKEIVDDTKRAMRALP